MDKDQAKGRGKNVAGRAEEAAGKLTGNEEQEARGKGRQMEGNVQKTAGDVKSKVKGVADKIRGK